MATNGLSKMAAATLLLLMSIVPAAVAVRYTVGDANQWTSGVDYTVWVTGKTFRIGDTLAFKYGPTHSVDVVDKAGYDGCDASSATEKHSDGDTQVELKTVGTRYFICPTPGHCISGMKLAVTVIASASSPATAPTPSSFPVSPPPPTPPPSSFPVSPPPPTPPLPPSLPVSPPPTPPLPSPAVPPTTPDLPRSDGKHEVDSGSTTPPPSSDASRGLMNYVVVGISLVLARNAYSFA